MNQTPKEQPKYTNEELEMFLSTTNYKTVKSTFLINWFSFKLQIRLFVAMLIGAWHSFFKQKNNKPQQNFVEDLLQEDDIDVCAVLDAKFRNPIKTWFASKLFKLGVAFKERRQKLNFFIKKLFKTNK